MLTKVEMMGLDWIYAHCCESSTTPFKWQNRKISLKRNHTVPNKYNRITWILLLSTLTLTYRCINFNCRCIVLSKTIGEGDKNGSIIHGILLLSNFAATILKLNTRLHKEDLIQLINQLLCNNSVWGMYI